MKRNLILLSLTCGLAISSWCAVPSSVNSIISTNLDIKLKSALLKESPDGVMTAESPALYKPVAEAPKLMQAPSKEFRLDSVVMVLPDNSKYTKQYFVFDNEGKILRQDNLVFNNSSKKWEINVQYLYKWYESGNIKSDEQIDAMGNATRNEYKYNSKNLGIERIISKRTGFDGEYIPTSKGEYDYDNAGNLTVEEIFSYNNNSWVPETKTTAAYDEDNHRTMIEVFQYVDGVWSGKEKQDTKYNKADLMTLLVEYGWNEKDKIFEPFSRLTNTFVKDSIFISQEFEYFNPEKKAWIGNFIDGRGIERYNSRSKTEYDSKGRIKLEYAQKLYGTEWFTGAKLTYDYTDNADGSYDCEVLKYVRSRGAENFTNSSIITSKVDAAGRTVYFYEKFLANIRLSSEWSEIYDSKGNSISREEYKFNAKGERYCYLKCENKYDDWGNVIETYNWQGKANASGLKDTWIYTSRFTYEFGNNGKVLTDKRRYKYNAASGSWLNHWGNGYEFDYTVPSNNIVTPVGYKFPYMLTKEYAYESTSGTSWDTAVYNYYYTKSEKGGIEECINNVESNITFIDNTLYINGGEVIENSVFSTDGRLVYKGNSSQEYLGFLGQGLYIVRSIVDGKIYTMKVTVM